MKPIFTRVFLLLIVPLCFSKSSFSQCGAALSSPTNDFAVSTSAVLNTYYPGTGNPVKGSTSLTVGTSIGSSTPIANGDMVLIIQMQGADFNSTNSDSYGDGVASGNASGYLPGTNLVAGSYEYNIVSAYNSGTGVVTLQYGLAHNYYTRAYSSTTGAQKYQLIRVPRYYNFTINNNRTVRGTAWDGSAGGVIVLEATNTFTFATSSSRINADGIGYRGGGGKNFTTSSSSINNTDYRWNSAVTTSANTTGGAKGEGIAGTPMYVYNSGNNSTTTNIEGYVDGSMGRGAPGNAGGGGTDGQTSSNQYNTGGGGGGNGGAGGRGGSGWDGGGTNGGNPATYNTGGYGGSSFAHASETKIVMGGGGGAGTANNATAANTEYLCSGAAGGGIVIVRAKSFVGSGSITANGVTSNDPSTTDAGGGGGAGGSIIVLTNTSTIATNTTITASAIGGNGGNSTIHYAHGPGGGGGGGVIISNVLSSGNCTVTGGSNGLTRTGATNGPIDNAYNATPGAAGLVRVMTTTPLLLSPGNVGSPCGILPITLNLWKGVYRNDKTYLTWETDKGVNFSHFVIERSADGAHYTSLGQVQASTATTLSLQYSFTDIAPASGTNYYRLKLVDADGTYQYSGIITIHTNVQGFNVSASPNPFTNNVTVTIESTADETVLLRVFNNDGKLVWRKSTSVYAGTNVQYFSELQALPKGIYYIKVNKQHSESSLKLIKQ